jgi:hypothetical protein
LHSDWAWNLDHGSLIFHVPSIQQGQQKFENRAIPHGWRGSCAFGKENWGFTSLSGTMGQPIPKTAPSLTGGAIFHIQVSQEQNHITFIIPA